MTGHSLATVPTGAAVAHGSTLGPTSLALVPFEVPPGVAALLSLGFDGDFADGCAMKGLARAKAEGLLEVIAPLAEKALAAIQPCPHQALIDRLTMLGMSMAGNKDADQIKAWLHETARLLSDLPQGILFAAIDSCVQEIGRVFLPSIGEIRAKASGPLQRREREAARLCYLKRLIEQGVEIPEYDPDKAGWLYGYAPRPGPAKDQCSPEEARRILGEYGLPSSFGEVAARALKNGPPKTRAETIAEGREPPPLTPRESDFYV